MKHRIYLLELSQYNIIFIDIKEMEWSKTRSLLPYLSIGYIRNHAIISYYFWQIQSWYGCIHGKSPVNPATSSEFDETFRVCRAVLADHFAKKDFLISPYLHRYTVEILLPLFVIFCVFLQEKNFKWRRKTDETSSFVSQIINPMTYSDSSWKTASESIGVQNIPSSFSITFCLTVCSSSHRKCMKNLIRKSEWTRYETYVVL